MSQIDFGRSQNRSHTHISQDHGKEYNVYNCIVDGHTFSIWPLWSVVTEYDICPSKKFPIWMWPNLSVTEFDTIDMVSYGQNSTFYQVKNVLPLWILQKLSVAEFDLPDMVWSVAGVIDVWPIWYMADMDGSRYSIFVTNRTFIVGTKCASAGNRTRAARVAGEHSTTEPPMLQWCSAKIYV